MQCQVHDFLPVVDRFEPLAQISLPGNILHQNHRTVMLDFKRT